MTYTPLRLLLVEDDEDDYLLTRDMLAEIQGMAYHLDWVSSYEAALAAIGRREHDVYLLDYRLGSHNGLDLIKMIASAGNTAPGILLTGQGDRHVDVEAMEAGAADYLVKSEITAALLERAIRYACQHAQAQAALQQRERRFRTLIERSFDGIVQVGPAGDVRYASPAMRTILGYQEDEFVGVVLPALVHPDDHDTIISMLQTLVDGSAGMAHREIRVRHCNSHYRWLEVVAANMLQEPGIDAIVLNIHDITERKWAEDEYAKLLAREQVARARAERAEASLGAIVASSPLPLITFDRDGLVQSWNGAARRVFGWTEEEVLGQAWPLVTDESWHESLALNARVANGEELRELEIRRRKRDGAWIDLQVSASPLRDAAGAVMGTVAAYADITARKQAEEALAFERDLLHSLMDAVPDLIYFKDRDSRFVRINKAQANNLGAASAEEALGKSDFDYYPAELAESLYARERIIIETGQPMINQLEDASDRANTPCWLLATKVPLSRNGQITGLVGITRDITERRLAEQRAMEAERFTRATLDALDEQIAILDETGTVLSINDAWRQFAHENGWYAENPGVGSNYLAVCGEAGDELAQAAAAGIAAVMVGQLPSFAQEYPCHAPGRERWYTMRVTRFAGDGPIRVVVAHLDSTARVKAEEALRDAHDKLELRVAARTAELAEANEALSIATVEAQTANRAKSEFLSRMSHELRTPLNAILGFAQILQMRDLGPRDNQSLEFILKAGRHLLELIDEVLDIARIEAGRLSLSLEPIDVGLSAWEVVQMAVPLATPRDITLINQIEAPRGLYVQADQQRLRQVLLNLVSNAIKYNRAGGQVMVSCIVREEGWLRLQVRDTGAGIRREDLPKLFMPFERLDADRTKIEGTGIGLTLSKRLAESMGGAIGVESEVGEGSTFWIDLPSTQTPPRLGRAADSGGKSAPVTAMGRQRTVLYIEDNPSNMALMEHLLGETAGVRLLTSMQAGLGLELAREHQPDLILLDLHLPDMMGDEVMRRLRADAQTREIPVAFLSSDTTPHAIERLRDAGAVAYLTKPIDVYKVLGLLNDILATERSGTHGL